MPIPSYADWMEYTKLDGMHPRSFALRDVDSALKAYWDKGKTSKLLSDLRLALLAWGKTCKGGDCRGSSRNKPPRWIVTELYKAVNEQPRFTREEMEAFRWQEEQRRKRVQAIFRNKRVVWKFCNAKKEIKTAHAELYANQDQWLKRVRPGVFAGGREALSAAGTAGEIARFARHGLPSGSAGNNFGVNGLLQVGGHVAGSHTRQAVHGMLGQVLNVPDLGEIGTELARNIGLDLTQFAADVTPFLSNVVSGGKLIVAWGHAAWAAWQQHATIGHDDFLSGAEDIRAALDALERLLERKRNALLRDATIQTTDFATRTALSFADFGSASSSVVGVATGIAKLLHKLFLFAREWHEKRKADTILADPDKLGLSMFNAYPLLGCYMLCCSDTSELISLSRAQRYKGGVPFGAAGWMDDVETLKKKHINPVLERAISFINDSPFEMPEMAMHVKYQPDILDRIVWVGSGAAALQGAGSVVRAFL